MGALVVGRRSPWTYSLFVGYGVFGYDWYAIAGLGVLLVAWLWMAGEGDIKDRVHRPIRTK
jgi:hypothetical protein